MFRRAVTDRVQEGDKTGFIILSGKEQNKITNDVYKFKNVCIIIIIICHQWQIKAKHHPGCYLRSAQAIRSLKMI
jgi:hypothetical protein